MVIVNRYVFSVFLFLYWFCLIFKIKVVSVFWKIFFVLVLLLLCWRIKCMIFGYFLLIMYLRVWVFECLLVLMFFNSVLFVMMFFLNISICWLIKFNCWFIFFIKLKKKMIIYRLFFRWLNKGFFDVVLFLKVFCFKKI